MCKNICSINARKIHKYSNGTDGHRAIGRTFPLSQLKSFSQAEMIILVYRHPTTDEVDLLPHSQRYSGSDPHRSIPVAQWPTVVFRFEQGESLRKVAGEYGVSYEAVRRVLRAARKKTG